MTLITCNLSSNWNQSSGFSLEVLQLNIGYGDEFAVYGENDNILIQVKNCDRTHLEVVSLFAENVEVSFTMGFASGNPLGRSFSIRYTGTNFILNCWAWISKKIKPLREEPNVVLTYVLSDNFRFHFIEKNYIGVL